MINSFTNVLAFNTQNQKAGTIHLILTFLLLTYSTLTIGQIVPPALGDTYTSTWIGIGVKQKLNTENKLGWLSDTYFGVGRISGKGSFNPFQKQGIIILNQEFYHQFHKNWEYSLAASYRNQDLYEKNEPYNHANPRFKHEFRFYTRFSYKLKFKRYEFVPTLRQEFIKYNNPDLSNYKENIRYRLRFRLKFSVTLDEQKLHKLTVYSEQLFYTAWMSNGTTKKFNYSDSRFSFYYSYSPAKAPIIIDIGYMNNLMGSKKAKSGHYLAIDVIWLNPFKK
ncbi:MAG: DUF2490 domain-containing protein [Crocinitomicaceae bacterium]|nr:DUF2490 domain-containing protein [Crocinitomicaceae bacterium]